SEQHLHSHMQEINKELNYVNGKISNLEKLISESLKKLGNISKIWGSSDLEGKRILHKTLFPDGIFYNRENHQYLTRNINKFVELVSSISNSCESKKNGSSQVCVEKSHFVAEMGVEPMTSGL